MVDFGKRTLPNAHASSHQHEGSDEIEATGLDGRVNYVDRGDPSADDFTLTDFTTDGTWNDLDLSAIVPVNTVAVHLTCLIWDNAVNSILSFRENGNSNIVNISSLRTQVSGLPVPADLIVKLDADRIIEYLGSNLAFVGIITTVKGWFI